MRTLKMEEAGRIMEWRVLYTGPALKHYRNYKCYIPTTNGSRTALQVEFYPKQTKMPK